MYVVKICRGKLLIEKKVFGNGEVPVDVVGPMIKRLQVWLPAIHSHIKTGELLANMLLSLKSTIWYWTKEWKFIVISTSKFTCAILFQFCWILYMDIMR